MITMTYGYRLLQRDRAYFNRREAFDREIMERMCSVIQASERLLKSEGLGVPRGLSRKQDGMTVNLYPKGAG